MNVLLITADQWRGDCVSAADHGCVRTPVLDELAADATCFLRHYSQATPCGPARASLFTGMYAMNHRSVTNGTPLDARHTDLAAELRRGGWRPTLFGYTDHSPDPRALRPDDPRLRSYEGVYDSFDVGLRIDEDAAAWLAYLEDRCGASFTASDVYAGPLGTAAPYPAEVSETAFLTDAAIAFLDRHEAAEPWFVHVSYLKPHPPLVAAAPYHALYELDEVPAPVRTPSDAGEARLHPWLAAKLAQPPDHSWWGKPITQGEAEIRRARAVYFGLVSELDHHIGRLLNAVRRRGELDETLIIVTADHGEMLGDHWLLGKEGFHPQAFHVPLIVRDPSPGAARGDRVEAFTEHVDLVPTVLERAGLDVPLQCDGASLVPLLEGERPADWRTAAHYEHDFRDVETGAFETALGLEPDRCALTARLTERYLYVHFNGLPALCFDLEDDPGQTTDIAAERARAPEVLDQAQALLSFRMAKAERRLTGCKLTPKGVIGRYG